MIDITIRGKGAIKNPHDLRDYRLELLGAVPLPTEFSVRDKIGNIKDQGSSNSCVAQAFSYYTELLNDIETNVKTQLSARDIYSLIFQKGGGAYIRDGAKKITNSGVVPEAEAPSYDKGNPPSEAYMENRSDITSQEKTDGMNYLAKSYYTFNNKGWDTFKQAIFQGQGCVSGAQGNNYCWQSDSGILLVPDKNQLDWGHCVLFTGWKIINGTEYLEFVNSWSDSWGDKGFGYMPKGYVDAGFVFNPVTLIDANNAYFSTAKKTISVLTNLISLYQQLIEKIKVGFKNIT